MDSEPLIATSGDIIITDNILPDPVGIIYHENDKLINVDKLEEYLKFLELIVFYNRLIILHYDFSNIFDDEILKVSFYRQFTYVGDVEADGFDDVKEKLEKANVLFEAGVDLGHQTPLHYVQKYVKSPLLQEKFNNFIPFSPNSSDSEFRDEAAYAKLSLDFGLPIALSEFARIARLPYFTPAAQFEHISWLENIEHKTQIGVVGSLRKAFNESLSRELELFDNFGFSTPFPKTPIASIILQESKGPNDLLEVACQLRREFNNFRETFNEYENELRREDLSLKRKLKMLHEIKHLTDELAPNMDRSLQKTTIELTNFINICAKAPLDISIKSIPDLVSSVISKPFDLVVAALKKRKIRILLKMQKKFLKSKNNVERLASIFGKTTDGILNSLHGSETQKK